MHAYGVVMWSVSIALNLFLHQMAETQQIESDNRDGWRRCIVAR
jgi:hypothetical protein